MPDFARALRERMEVRRQCRHLAEQGWREVPSVEEIADEIEGKWLGVIIEDHIASVIAVSLHRWLVEGGSE